MKLVQVIPLLLQGKQITCNGFRCDTYLFIDEECGSVKISRQEGISDYIISKVDMVNESWQIFPGCILNCKLCGNRPYMYVMDDGRYVIQCQGDEDEPSYHYTSISNHNKSSVISTWNKLMGGNNVQESS